MKEGEYTLIVTAIWDGASKDVEGFQLNAFKINIINNDKFNNILTQFFDYLLGTWIKIYFNMICK